MGYSDLIDKLLDTRIDEGMISSISKNKDKNADIDSLCSALLNGSLFRIPTKYIDIRDTHYYNKSSFDSGLLRYTISTESLNTQRGRNYRIYRMIKGDEYYFMITLSSVDRVFTRMKRCVIQKCDGEEVADTIWDFVDKNRLVFDMDGMNSGLKDCKTVANTYRVFGSKLLSDVYGIADTSYILKDTKEVLGALFKSSVGLFKSDYKGFKYESDMSELASSCVDYEIRFDKDVLSIKFNFKDAEIRKKIYTLICENRIRSNQLYSLVLPSNDIVFEFYI